MPLCAAHLWSSVVRPQKNNRPRSPLENKHPTNHTNPTPNNTNNHTHNNSKTTQLGAQAAAARAAFAALLVELRPDAVALVDAWGFPDYLLHSALGRADGDVYRALYAMAQNSPLNATQVGPAWEPLLKGVMLRKGVPKL